MISLESDVTLDRFSSVVEDHKFHGCKIFHIKVFECIYTIVKVARAWGGLKTLSNCCDAFVIMDNTLTGA